MKNSLMGLCLLLSTLAHARGGNDGFVLNSDGSVSRGGAGGVGHPGGGQGNYGGGGVPNWVAEGRRRDRERYLAEERHRRIVAQQQAQARAMAEQERLDRLEQASRIEQARQAELCRLENIRIQEFIANDRIYRDYEFRAPTNTQTSLRLHGDYQSLYCLDVQGNETRGMAREYGLLAYQEADQSFAENNEADGNAYYELGKAFADVAVGIDPVTGFGRSVYELTTGRNLITQENLTTFERTVSAVNVLTIGSFSSVTRAGTALVRIANRAHNVINAANSATHIVSQSYTGVSRTLRNAPGIARAATEVYNPAQLLRGTHANAAKIPTVIAERLEGREFRNFNQFRKEFWKEVARSPYAEEFASIHPENLALMTRGNAPLVHESQRLSAAARYYQLHHLENIQHGGSVYDMNNLVIASPLFHNRVFHSRR